MKSVAFVTTIVVISCVICSTLSQAQQQLTCFVGLRVQGDFPTLDARNLSQPRQCAVGEECGRIDTVLMIGNTSLGVASVAGCVPTSSCGNLTSLSDQPLRDFVSEYQIESHRTGPCFSFCCNTSYCNKNNETLPTGRLCRKFNTPPPPTQATPPATKPQTPAATEGTTPRPRATDAATPPVTENQNTIQNTTTPWADKKTTKPIGDVTIGTDTTTKPAGETKKTTPQTKQPKAEKMATTTSTGDAIRSNFLILFLVTILATIIAM